jgi:hypothetical protein
MLVGGDNAEPWSIIGSRPVDRRATITARTQKFIAEEVALLDL